MQNPLNGGCSAAAISSASRERLRSQGVAQHPSTPPSPWTLGYGEQHHEKMRLKTALLACVAIAGNAQAVAVAGQGTWETTLLGRDINGNAVAGNADTAVFLYDTVLDVTWLRDANANGLMNWTRANTWAANLLVGAYDDWRLPTMIATPNTTYSNAGGTDYGYNVRTTSGSTVYSEMASLWCDTLGNKASCPPDNDMGSAADTPQPGWGLTNTGDFQNLQSGVCWSGLEYAPNVGYAWDFGSDVGFQGYGGKAFSSYALALRPYDVVVPAALKPETYALMLAGLAVAGAAAKRRKAK